MSNRAQTSAIIGTDSVLFSFDTENCSSATRKDVMTVLNVCLFFSNVYLLIQFGLLQVNISSFLSLSLTHRKLSPYFVCLFHVHHLRSLYTKTDFPFSFLSAAEHKRGLSEKVSEREK